MATLTIKNSNSPKNMAIRLTYTAGNGTITISKVEGCRTDGYSTNDSGKGTMKVTIGGSTQNISITYPKFNANSSWNTIYSEDITNSNCSGNTNISIGFSGFSISNINNANFSTSIEAGYKAPSLIPTSYKSGVDYIDFVLTNSIQGANAERIEIRDNDNNLLYSGESLKPRIPNLVPNTTYDIKARGYANEVWGDYTPTVKIKTLDVAKTIENNTVSNIEKHTLIPITNPSNSQVNLVVRDVISHNELIRENNVLPSSVEGAYTYDLIFTDTQMNTILQLSKDFTNYFLELIVETVGEYDTYEEYSSITLDLVDSNPTFNVPTYKDVNSITTEIMGNSQKIIVNHSEVEITISRMTTKNYASPAYYNVIKNNIIIDNIVDDGSSTYEINIGTIEGNNVQVEAVDSRGLVTSVTLNMDLVEYTPVSFDITKFSVLRENNVGEEVTLKAEGTYDIIEEAQNPNTITKFSYRFQKEGSSEWSELQNLTNFTYTNGKWAIETTIDGDTTLGFNPEYSYNIEAYVYDKLSKGNIFSGINTAKSLVWYDKKNGMVGIGGKPEYQLDVYGRVNAGDFLIDGVSILDSKIGEYLMVTLDTQQTLTLTSAYEKLNLRHVVSNKGNSLISRNGEIVIGEGVNYVRVVGKAYFYTGEANNRKGVQITHNGSVASRDNGYVSELYQTLSVTEKILNVSNGDVISLEFLGYSGDIIQNYDFSTYLQVEVIG